MSIVIDQEICFPVLNRDACQECLRVCSMGVFLVTPAITPIKPGQPILEYRLHVAQPRLCLKCRRCVNACPVRALQCA